jgi:hypothetical protein
MQKHKIIDMKKPHLLFYLTIVVIAFALNACYYDNAEELYPDSKNCDVSNIDYNLDIKPIVDSNCALSGCHISGTGRKDFSTFQGLKDVLDDGRLRQHVVINKTMPPSGPLSTCNIAKIDAWIQAGGPSQ